MSPLLAKLRALFRRKNLEAEMAEEMRQHLERRIQEKITDGLSPEEARYAAQREFGGIAQVQEQCRDERRFVWLEQAAQDLRFAARSLRKSPGFTAVVIVSLALGIGANTTIFSLVNAFLLRALPVKNPDELVAFRHSGARVQGATQNNSSRNTSFSLAAFEQFRAHGSTALAELFAYAPVTQVNVLIGGRPEVEVPGQYVSGNYHAALGVTPLLGRALTPEDDSPAAEPVVVLSHRFWRSRFAGDPAVIGRTLQLNQVVVTVVGVTPPGFSGIMQAGDALDFSVPFALLPRLQPEQQKDKLQPWFWWVHLMGRAKPGTTPAQAAASLDGVFREVARMSWQAMPRAPGAESGEMPALPTLLAESGARGENDRRLEHTKSLRLLMGLVGLVLLAACANVANLLLTRGAARRREIAVRLALGAGRGRVVRQLLAESLALAVLGAAAGTLFALWARGALLALRPVGTAVVLDLPLDGRVLGFTIAVTAVTALLFGLAPALRATRVDLATEFQGGARLLGPGARSWLSRGLMIVQLALSVVLLVGTGLFVRTLRNLESTDSGFNRDGLVLFRLEATPTGYRPEQIPALHERLRERFARLPGVRAATYSDVPLISGRRIGFLLTVSGYTPPAGGQAGANATSVAPNFFAALEMPLVLGRGYTARDDAAAPKVMVVNQAFARKFFGDVPRAVGGRLSVGSGPTVSGNDIEIVGVVRDAHYTDLRDPPQPTIYPPLLQRPALGGTATFALRVAGDPRAVFPTIRAAVAEIDPLLPVRDLRTQAEQLDRLNAQPILFARLSGFFGVLALSLASVGLYGLMSYAVLRRTGEIGLRLALGAQPGRVLRMILRESLGLVGIGVLVGLVGAAGATRLVASMLFDLSPTDPLTYAGVATLLVVVALVACLLPARRAAKVDPMVALRSE